MENKQNSMVEIQEEPTSREKLEAFANLIVSKCTHDEIDMLCVSLLDANMKCRRKSSEHN